MAKDGEGKPKTENGGGLGMRLTHSHKTARYIPFLVMSTGSCEHINCFFFFSIFRKRDPAGSMKHRINLVWPRDDKKKKHACIPDQGSK